MTDEIQTRTLPVTGPFKAKATCASCGREWIAPGAAQGPDTRVREALEAVVSVSQSGADTVSFLVELQRVAKLCASALAALPQPGAVKAEFDPTNHHNALKCPYCNPDGLAFAPKSPALDPATVEACPRVAAETGRLWGDNYGSSANEAADKIRALLASGASNADTSTVRGSKEDIPCILCMVPDRCKKDGCEFNRGWPEPKVTNPDIADPTGVPYLNCLIHRVLDAQHDVNFAANEGMNQSLSNVAELFDEIETVLRKAALYPVPQTARGEQ